MNALCSNLPLTTVALRAHLLWSHRDKRLFLSKVLPSTADARSKQGSPVFSFALLAIWNHRSDAKQQQTITTIGPGAGYINSVDTKSAPKAQGWMSECYRALWDGKSWVKTLALSDLSLAKGEMPQMAWVSHDLTAMTIAWHPVRTCNVPQPKGILILKRRKKKFEQNINSLFLEKETLARLSMKAKKKEFSP